ncbi:uncharacterized protein N7483_003775 [Penicillium malachiteum]|uniref:uncharacterized protein n=1 Tax=Penicillium malachiteum TaxID=1324776 RepID=UPI0025480E03|nr:uncharacterized protein N7483_003775 [Penicillium malachiteum]KAJ5729267.1 hypothetical protein N7483_003775 [Penicillium malachiteum]
MDAAMLQCIICPGQPRFSDASHLLTHIASKAHLSFYFKLQVRSHQESNATDLLAEYDDWYSTNSLAQLLSDRMTSKEDRKKKRKSQTKIKTEPDVQPQLPQRSSRRLNPPKVEDQSSQAIDSFPDYLDPRLAGSPTSQKQDSNIQETSFFPSYITPATPTPTGAVAVADMHAEMPVEARLQLGLASAMDALTHNEVHGQFDGGTGNLYGTLPETPKAPRARRRRSAMSSMGHDMVDPFLDDSMHTGESNNIDAEKERADEMARLKGILWPGMDIFDSATQQMRRKRNQKKDQNVLKMMEMTSLQVEPTELIFSPTGILRKQRVISGNVEDDSPLKGETPIPKRRPPRPKKDALRRVDPNVTRAQDRKGGRKTAHNTRNRRGLDIYDDHDVYAGSPSPPRLNGGMKTSKPPYASDDGELGLAVQAFSKRPRNGFTIYADEVDQASSSFKDQFAYSKVSRDTLTPARLHLDRKTDSGIHGGKFNQLAIDKENIEPIMTTQGRIGLHEWHSPFPRRSDTDNVGYTPRFYYEEPMNGDFGADGEQESAAYRSNPLLAPSSKMEFYDTSLYGGDIGMVGWGMSPHVPSSEATVSEEDQHDLAQLYLTAHAD